MRKRRLALLTLPIVLVSGFAHAATVHWRPGETTPPTEIVPMSPSELDTVSFTAAGSATFSNACEAGRLLGFPTISTDAAAHEFKVEFSQADPSSVCAAILAPVNGIEGELGQLEPGPWTLTITNVNVGSEITLPFTVRLASDASGSLILHTLANDQTTGTSFPFDRRFFVARPLGAHCNPENGGLTCGATTLQHGAPLKGTAPVDIGPAASFTVPRYALKATATGSLPLYGPYDYISTFATHVRNERGVFGPGSGPGELTLYFFGVGEPAARISIHRGKNQFGGTMRLLGAMGSKRAHEYRNKRFVASDFSSFGVVGGYLRGPCSDTCRWNWFAESNFQSRRYQTTMGKSTLARVTTAGLPWTTGTVTITATDGPFPTLFRRNGYDNRTAKGLGTIQMVAPQLARWEFPDREAPWDRHTGAIGILRIRFVPEPSGWAMLAAGAGWIALFCRRRRRPGISNR
jgi:hypothetical protein